ncbi:MSMEG_1061 family FMN-dependent PPOX-type flavoprotein [Paenibacillus sp. 598K]|uniref:MSMEG_1061 family FMN-dependent PPOX-type flavoprotein n=1 Tax=Paenibacillus sp. 598K TaxID=1117987 RepID=UPI000FFF678A
MRADETTIGSERELRVFLGEPTSLSIRKVKTQLDESSVAFIQQSPFLVIGSASQSGSCDVSPRGDQPGFVSVESSRHLMIPERPGNRRLDTLSNIIENPHVGLIFIVPGVIETLRVNGIATITKDPSLLEKMAVKGKPPLVGIYVEVEECYLHCGKAFLRSSLWSPDTWNRPSNSLDSAAILAKHTNSSKEDMVSLLNESYTKRLY